MNRNQRQIYCFLYDDNKHFYRATQSASGDWNITHNSELYPIKHNPKNLAEAPVEMGTNKRYFSMFRSLNYPLEFILDGAAILNYKYTTGKGFNENMYLAMFEFDSVDGKYKLSYNGRIDFQQKKRNEKLATFTAPVVDDSGWGILSQNDDVEYSFDCSESNPKAIRVLFDNISLKNRYTFQTVQSKIQQTAGFSTHAVPFVLVNQDGDSSGIITKSQTLDKGSDAWNGTPANAYSQNSVNCFFETFYPITGGNVNIQGSFKFGWSNINSAIPSGGLVIYFKTSKEQVFEIFNQSFGGLVVGKIYDLVFDFDWSLEAGERIFLLSNISDATLNQFAITPIVTNVFVTTLTKVEATTCYALRPLDLLQAIVNKATLQRYSINSSYFEVDNKAVLLSGESIRGLRDAKIYTSFKDFFESYSALFFMALRVVNGSLFMELADEVYKQDSNIIDLGDILEIETYPAIEYIPNEVEVGSPNQDYRHASGRLETNSVANWSFPFTNIKNKLSLTTKYRTDPWGIIFLLLDYKGSSTQDNIGDKQVFVVDITDEVGSAVEEVSTFENFTVSNAPLAPIIKYPLSGDIINNDNPLLKGIGIPGTDVDIYIGAVLDGGTVVQPDGTWEYQIVAALPSYNPGVTDGISVINATNTDMAGALNTIQLIIDTTIASSIGLTYPRSGDSLYNNLPLIRGVAPPGTNINISLNGVFVAAVVADNSCKFEYKFVVPIPNGNNILSINGQPDVTFTVNSSVDFPLITYIGSELDGFPIVNNLPLIRGVAKPGEQVKVWLDYIKYEPLGTVFADANGNWELQVVPVNYIDPLTNTPTVLAPIKNGANVLSTLLINNVVNISVTGFKLNRPAWDSITGVLDDTIFNIRFSNMRALLNHKSLLAGIMDKQRNDVITWQKHTKNPNLRTVLGTEVVDERANIGYNQLGTPLMLMEMAKLKVISRHSFYKTLYDFNNGGLVEGLFKGKPIYFLPIGNMKMNSIMDSVQDWNLMISPKTSYNQLLNLYKNGLLINIMKNSVFHSDCNTLHFVEYNKALPAKYNFKDIYDDWFTNRNEAWLTNPQYIQKLQTSEIFRDQVISNGIGAMTLRMYRCSDAKVVTTFNYNPVNPAPIPIPEIVLETPDIDLGDYPPDQYFFVQMIGEFIVAISERIETRVRWPRTILIESENSYNEPGVFYSSGFKQVFRIEGLMGKVHPYMNVVTTRDENGGLSNLYRKITGERLIRFGNAAGMPDYLSMKLALAISKDTVNIENGYYCLLPEEKLRESEPQPGVPMFYYEATMGYIENPNGKVFAGVEGADVTGVVLVVDASAIGLPPDNIIMIEES